MFSVAKKKSLLAALAVTASLILPAFSFAAGIAESSVVRASRSDRVIGDFPAFGTERILPDGGIGNAVFTVSAAKLTTGQPYLAAAPYSASLALISPDGENRVVRGGLPLVFQAESPDALFELVADPDFPGSAELALRGLSVMPLREALLAIIARGLLFSTLAAALLGYSFARLRRSAVPALPLSAMLISALFASLTALLPLASIVGFRSASALAARIAPLSLAAFLVTAALALVSLSPRRWTFVLFLVYAAAASAAAAFSVLTSFPPALPFLAFSAFSFLVFSVSFIAALSLRAGREAIFSFGAALSAAAFALSGIVWEQNAEASLAFAGLVPLLLAATRHGAPAIRVDKEDVIVAPVPRLSDQAALTRFVPKEFLAILKKESVADLMLGDHVKQDMTIFFSDIRKFTTLSESLTPEENFKFINSYLARIVPVVTDFGGFVDKYIGDAIMALFPTVNGADQAVQAGIAMQRRIVEYNGHRATCGYRPLSMGIGLHTGTLMLGVVGVEDRMQNTVISDAVNLASRLESITKVFNVSLAISEETFKSLQDPGAYFYRFIGKVRVKGKAEPVSVFEIFDGVDPELFDRKMKASRFFEQGMMSYYQKEFTGAMYFFRKVIENLPEDGAAAFYLDNCIAKTRA